MRCHTLNHALARIATQERGASLVLLSLMVTVLMSFAGLAVDGSNAYLQQQRMQVAADAGVLAGIRLLALGKSTPLEIKNEVESLSMSNGADSFTLSYLNDNSEIRVTAMRTFDTYFVQIIGTYTMTASAEANARFGSVSQIGNLMPMTLTCSDVESYALNVVYTLHDSDKIAPGNIGWLTWNGSNSASTLANNIAYPGASPELNIGDLMEGVPGNKNSVAVRDALDSWINKTVTIPLYDNVTGNGSNVRYRICGFAQFVITSHDNKTISGKFVQRVVSGTDFSFDNPDFGSRDVRLTK